MERMLKRAEVCEILGVSDTTLGRLVSRRAIPFYKIGGSVRFKEVDLERYVAGQRREVVPPGKPGRKKKAAAVSGGYYPGMKVV